MIYPTKHELLATSGKYVDMMCTMKLCKGNKFMIGTSLAKPILCLSIIYYMEAKGCVSNSFQRKELIPFFSAIRLALLNEKKNPEIYNPFSHMQNDGFWLSDENNDNGQLQEELFRFLSGRNERIFVTNRLLEVYFPDKEIDALNLWKRIHDEIGILENDPSVNSANEETQKDETKSVGISSIQKSFSFGNVPDRLEYSKPISVTFPNGTFPANKWSDVQYLCYSYAFLHNRSKVLELADSYAPFRKTVLFSHHAENLRRPKELFSNFFMETNFSTLEIMKIVCGLINFCGFPLNDFSVSYYDNSGDNNSGNQLDVSFQTLNEKVIRPEFVSESAVVLKEAFPRGLRRGSLIDRNRFCNKYAELTGCAPTEEDLSVLWEACSSSGIVLQNIVFPLTEEAAALVRGKIEEIASSGIRQGYYSVIFENNQQDFCNCGIGSVEVLVGAMRKLYPDYAYYDCYFCTDRSVTTEDEVIRVLKDAGLMSADEIQMLLPCISKDRIIQVCRASNQIIKDNDSFILLEQLRFDENEADRTIACVKKNVQIQGYALLRELNLENSESLNNNIRIDALKRGFFQKYLASDFHINRGVISANDTSLSVGKVLTAFCEEHMIFTLNEVENLAQELNGYPNNQGLATARQVAIQVDDEHFVHPGQLDFDIEGIDNALSEIMIDGMIPLQGITSFISFPAVSGYNWTYQLLASYCRLVSKVFTLLEAAGGSNTCTGLIVLRNAAYSSYYQAAATMAIRDNIAQDFESVSNYAIRMGLLSRRRPSAVNSILSEMKNLTGET